jgi:hypothetical protein
MGWPPLYNVTTHLNLPRDLLDRIDAIVGPKGRSKFVRDALRQLLGRLAPVPERPVGHAIWEFDGGQEPRLSAAGTAAMIEQIRKIDQVMQRLETTDPMKFLQVLVGHAEVSDQWSIRISQTLAAHRIPSATFEQTGHRLVWGIGDAGRGYGFVHSVSLSCPVHLSGS